MPKGTFHKVEGTLRRTKHGYGIEVDNGGVWKLFTPMAFQMMINRKVIIYGRRHNFDMLDLHAIHLAEHPPVRKLGFFRRIASTLRHWWRAALHPSFKHEGGE